MAFNRKLGFFVTPMVLALGASAAFTGCNPEDAASDLTDTTGGLCCDGFEVGADLSDADFGVDAELEGKFKVYAQAMADLSGVAAATLGDIEVACGNIAADLGASAEALNTANSAKGTAKVEALCNLATAQIDGYFGAQGEFTAEGSLVIDFQEPHCSASVSAKADCQASCSGSAECDVQANPPTCEGGKLQVSCEGSCTAEAGASIACEGKCEGSCSGSCQAAVNATVDCQGKCEGTCEAKAGVGTGTGAQADGTCHGTCSGTCEMAADANVECTGTCKGSCDASCTAEAGASVKCDGQCDGEFEPLKCEGGELKGGCEVEASCDANCNASASAKAECTPPALTVVFEARANASLEVDAQARLDVALNSLKANLPNILVAVKARGGSFMGALEGSVDAGVDVVADPGSLGATGAICFAKIAAAGATALGNMKASVEAAGSVTASLDL